VIEMMVVLELSLVFTIGLSVVLWFYWIALFPCLVLKGGFRIQRISDGVRLSVLEKKISPESRGYIELQYFLDLSARAARHADLLGVTSRRKPARFEHTAFQNRIEAIMKDGSPEIREAFVKCTRWTVALWLAARPIWLIPLAVLILLAFFSDWADRQAKQKKEEAFAVVSGLPA
jgi:hypothetical protein